MNFLNLELILAVLIGLILFHHYGDFVELFISKKKRHFKKRFQGTEAALWDMEFQKDKLRQIREGFRMEFDKINENYEGRKRFAALIRKYGLELATKIKDYSPDLVDRALNKFERDETEEIKKSLGLTELKGTNTEQDKKAIGNLEKQIEPIEKEVNQLKTQMGAIDNEIEGLGGVNEKIEGMIELTKMLKEFIKKKL